MIFVSFETVDSSSALRAATRWAFARSAPISSSLAITVPHSCASTESRNVSSSDSGLGAVDDQEDRVRRGRGASGNAHHDEKPPISSWPGLVSLASVSPIPSGARS